MNAVFTPDPEDQLINKGIERLLQEGKILEVEDEAGELLYEGQSATAAQHRYDRCNGHCTMHVMHLGEDNYGSDQIQSK
jgi:hypothetical protein